MSIDKKEKSGPDLEAIAKKYAVYDEETHLDELSLRLMDTLISSKFSDGATFKYTTSDGKTRYNVNLSDKQKNELADNLSKALVYQAYVIKFGEKPADLEGFMKIKDKHTGEYLCDDLLRSNFGVTRYTMKKQIEALPKITPEFMKQYVDRWVGTQKQKIESYLQTQAAEAGLEPLKAFIKKSFEKAPADQKNEIDKALSKMYSVDENLLGLYGQAAQYHKPAKKSK